MGDSQRENAWFSPKLTILKEKTQDFRLNGGFAKGERVIFALKGDFRKRLIIA